MITGYVTGQSLKLSAPMVVADSINYLEAQFLFRQRDWDGTEVYAVFETGGKSYTKPLTNGRIRQEDGLNLTAGTWKVHLVGFVVSGGELVRRITTDQVDIVVKPSGNMTGEPLPEIPASDLERVEAKLSDHENRISHLEQYGGGESGYVPPMVGATDSKDGSAGLVPAPLAGQQDAVLHGDGTWRKVSGGGGSVSAEIADGGMFLTTSMSVTISGGGMMIA